MSVTLKLGANPEVLLDGTENLGTFVLDHAGAVGMDHQVIRKVIGRLVRALNTEHEQVAALQSESDELQGDVFSLKEKAAGADKTLQIFQEAITGLKIDLGKVSARVEVIAKHAIAANEESGPEAQLKKVREEFQDMKEFHRELFGRFEATEKAQREDTKRFASQLKEWEEAGVRYSALHAEHKQRVQELDDSIISLKLDLESMQGSLTESNKAKASKTDFSEMQTKLKIVLQEVEHDHATLLEAASNLGKLETCISMATENQARSEDIWRVFRQETQELREWAARAFGDVREQLHQKLDKTFGVTKMTELEGILRDRTEHLAEMTARAEADVQRKADAGDVQRLQRSVRDFRSQQERRTRTLLVGTKCLACDRGLPVSAIADETAIDNAKLHQQEELWREVQKVLAEKHTHGKNYGQDLLKFVAVKVGSPRRSAGVGGLGPFEVRDAGGDGDGRRDDVVDDDGVHRLISPGAAPRTVPRPPDHGELPARAPPREATPIVRMAPNRLRGFEPSKARAGTAPTPTGFGGFKRSPPPTHTSVKSALGPPPRSADSATPRRGHPSGGTPPPLAPPAPAAFDSITWDDGGSAHFARTQSDSPDNTPRRPSGARLPSLNQPSASGGSHSGGGGGGASFDVTSW